MRYSTGDIVEDDDIFVAVEEGHYALFNDGIIRDLLSELNDEGGYKLIPTRGLEDDEVDDMSDAIRIIAGTAEAHEELVNDKVWIIRMLRTSRYLNSRQLLQAILPHFGEKYEYPELLFWFVLSHIDGDSWSDITHKSVDFEHIDMYNEYVTMSYGFNHIVPIDNESFFSLFNMNVSDMPRYLQTKYKFKHEKTALLGGKWTNYPSNNRYRRGIQRYALVDKTTRLLKDIPAKYSDLEFDYIVMEGMNIDRYLTSTVGGHYGFMIDLGIIAMYTLHRGFGSIWMVEDEYFEFRKKYGSISSPSIVAKTSNIENVAEIYDSFSTIVDTMVNFERFDSLWYNSDDRILSVRFIHTE